MVREAPVPATATKPDGSRCVLKSATGTPGLAGRGAPPLPWSVRLSVDATSYWNWSETIDPIWTVADCDGVALRWPSTSPALLSVTV